jgi:ferrochelatase
MRNNRSPFDAVLIVAFGGPQGRQDIRPFLGNVLHGRRIPPQRIEQVAASYELFDGISPLTEITFRQADALKKLLEQQGIPLPVYVGMRHWHPFLADTLAEMAAAGVRRAVGLIASPFHSYASCTQYKEAVRSVRQKIVDDGRPDIPITYVDSWYNHPDFIAANVNHVREALDKLDANHRATARIIFTAHSIPATMAEACRYREQLNEAAQLIAAQLDQRPHALVYQSRSGRPEEPWLEPDLCDFIRGEAEKGLRAAVLSPLGFICDHIEVMYEVDHRAIPLCRELNIPTARAEALNDDPLLINMMADIVKRTYDRSLHGYPLDITG